MLQVKHSQKFNEKVLKAWIIILKNGSIASAHCLCMAGLGEVCSHVAAILFLLYSRPTTSQEELACTDKLSVWPVPCTKNIDMIRVCDIDWPGKERRVKAVRTPLPSITNDELTTILKQLQNIDISPAISRLWEPFASEMSEGNLSNVPQCLSDLFDPSLVGEEYDRIIQVSRSVDVSVTPEQHNIVEELTRDQYQNNMWFKCRSGRITASKFKGVCRTKIQKPSLSLLKSICYPQKFTFTSKQTTYGLKNESIALDEYMQQMRQLHINPRGKRVGFCISQKQPEFGASPDMVIDCDCCGTGSVEVKCPYLLQDITLEKFVHLKSSCLIKSGDDYALDRNHSYYYQVQLQMYVLDVKYCDFVIWSKDISFIERIAFDSQFCKENIIKCLDFFNYVIKPELLARYFTNKPGTASVQY